MEKYVRPKHFIIKGTSWSVEMVKNQILHNDEALKRAILRIYSFQEEDEKRSEETHYSNGKGFNGSDAQILSSFAKQIEEKNWLSPKQVTLARKRMVKYSGQIFDYIVNQRRDVFKKFGLS